MSIIQSDYRLQVKAEATYDARDTSFASGATFLPLVGGIPSIKTAKQIENIQSNLGHPHARRVAVARNNEGGIASEFNIDTRTLLMDMAFGGLTSGLPDRNTSYGLNLRKGSITGALFTGCKVNQATIEAAAGGIVGFNMDLVTAHEEKISAPTIALPGTTRVPYRFCTAIAILNNALATSVENINLVIANNLARGPHRTGAMEISYLEYGQQNLTGSVGLLYEAETYNDLVRGTATGSIYLLFGDSMATYLASGVWNTDDYFTAADPVITFASSTLALDSVASVGPLALTTLITPSTGDVCVQNPVLIKLNSLEFPNCPENAGDGGIVKQTVNFEETATSDGSAPVHCFIDAVS